MCNRVLSFVLRVSQCVYMFFLCVSIVHVSPTNAVGVQSVHVCVCVLLLMCFIVFMYGLRVRVCGGFQGH